MERQFNLDIFATQLPQITHVTSQDEGAKSQG
jgi:hypothetical protein